MTTDFFCEKESNLFSWITDAMCYFALRNLKHYKSNDTRKLNNGLILASNWITQDKEFINFSTELLDENCNIEKLKFAFEINQCYYQRSMLYCLTTKVCLCSEENFEFIDDKKFSTFEAVLVIVRKLEHLFGDYTCYLKLLDYMWHLTFRAYVVDKSRKQGKEAALKMIPEFSLNRISYQEAIENNSFNIFEYTSTMFNCIDALHSDLKKPFLVSVSQKSVVVKELCGNRIKNVKETRESTLENDEEEVIVIPPVLTNSSLVNNIVVPEPDNEITIEPEASKSNEKNVHEDKAHKDIENMQRIKEKYLGQKSVPPTTSFMPLNRKRKNTARKTFPLRKFSKPSSPKLFVKKTISTQTLSKENVQKYDKKKILSDVSTLPSQDESSKSDNSIKSEPYVFGDSSTFKGFESVNNTLERCTEISKPISPKHTIETQSFYSTKASNSVTSNNSDGIHCSENFILNVVEKIETDTEFSSNMKNKNKMDVSLNSKNKASKILNNRISLNTNNEPAMISLNQKSKTDMVKTSGPDNKSKRSKLFHTDNKLKALTIRSTVPLVDIHRSNAKTPTLKVQNNNTEAPFKIQQDYTKTPTQGKKQKIIHKENSEQTASQKVSKLNQKPVQSKTSAGSTNQKTKKPVSPNQNKSNDIILKNKTTPTLLKSNKIIKVISKPLLADASIQSVQKSVITKDSPPKVNEKVVFEIPPIKKLIKVNFTQVKTKPTARKTVSSKPHDNYDLESIGTISGMSYKSTDTTKGRSRRKWSLHQDFAIILGVDQFGMGKWELVRKHPIFNDSNITGVNVKDRWRTMVKNKLVTVDSYGQILSLDSCFKRFAAETEGNKNKPITPLSSDSDNFAPQRKNRKSPLKFVGLPKKVTEVDKSLHVKKNPVPQQSSLLNPKTQFKSSPKKPKANRERILPLNAESPNKSSHNIPHKQLLSPLPISKQPPPQFDNLEVTEGYEKLLKKQKKATDFPEYSCSGKQHYRRPIIFSSDNSD